MQLQKNIKRISGRSLGYENAGSEVYDKDDDSNDYEDSDIKSNVNVKLSIVNKTLNKITNMPVDKNIILLACQYAYGENYEYYTSFIQAIIEEVTDKMFKDLPLFFSSLIGSFLFQTNSKTKKVYTISDLKSPTFLNVGIETLVGKKSHLKDENMKICREIFYRMLEDYSDKYNSSGETSKRGIRNALAAYWVFMIKSSN